MKKAGRSREREIYEQQAKFFTLSIYLSKSTKVFKITSNNTMGNQHGQTKKEYDNLVILSLFINLAGEKWIKNINKYIGAALAINVYVNLVILFMFFVLDLPFKVIVISVIVAFLILMVLFLVILIFLWRKVRICFQPLVSQMIKFSAFK